jgi:cytochrome c nitrite reductase small subunit
MRVRGFTLASGLIGGLFGATAGIGGFTFIYAKGGSYLGHDSSACANCHVMNEQYDGWIKSSHRAVAQCNDCHAPHDPLGKYATKAMNGFRHSLAFTTGRFPEPIRITPGNRAVTEGACRHCHDDVVQGMRPGGPGHGGGHDDGVDCLRCHHSVGHAELSPVALHTGGAR